MSHAFASHDPMTILADAWTRLRAGQADGHHPFRTATLATADALGRPDARTVVLRRVDEPLRRIDFQTDRRSPKFFGLQHNGSAAWLFYDATDQLQLRLQTSVMLHTHDAVADEAWARVPAAAREPYRAALAAGADVSGPFTAENTPLLEHDGRVNFVVARCRIESFEWLRREGDVWRRLRFSWTADSVGWQWIAP